MNIDRQPVEIARLAALRGYLAGLAQAAKIIAANPHAVSPQLLALLSAEVMVDKPEAVEKIAGEVMQ